MSGQRGRGGHDSWEEHRGASGGEIERLKRDLDEANRRADTMQERLNLQKQATVQAGIPRFPKIQSQFYLCYFDGLRSGSIWFLDNIIYFGNATRN